MTEGLSMTSWCTSIIGTAF